MRDIFETVLAKGYTRRVYIDFGALELDALIRPEVETDGSFRAFDTSNNEWLEVNGWMACSIEDVLADVCTNHTPLDPVQLELFPRDA